MSSSWNSSQTDIQKIREWLAEVFDDEEVPQFEESEQTIKTLQKLMRRNLEAEKNAKNTIKLQQEMIGKYKKASEDLSSRLDCGININSETSEALNCLAHFASDMNLKQPTKTNFVLAIHEMKEMKIETKKEAKTVQYYLSSVSQKIKEEMEEHEVLIRELEDMRKIAEIQKNRNSSIKNNASFFQKKNEQYKFKLNKLEKQLENVGCNPSLYHHNLVEQSEKIKEMEEDLKNVKTNLKAYESLPPNEELAKLKVQEMQQEVKALEEEFQTLVNLASET